MIMSRSTAETANMLLRIRRGHCHCRRAPTHQLISSHISMKSIARGHAYYTQPLEHTMCCMFNAGSREKTEGAYEDGQAGEMEEL